jgi:short-subunit dehydrogenase
MKANNPPGGGLVITGSTSSYNERPNLPLYSTAKHGVVGLMHAVRHWCPEDNINVGLIAPGGTVSSLLTLQAAEAFEARGVPINNASTVALAAVYLANNKEPNGKSLTIIGDRFTEVEDSIARTQPLWYGEYNTDMSRRVATVRLDKLA